MIQAYAGATAKLIDIGTHLLQHNSNLINYVFHPVLLYCAFFWHGALFGIFYDDSVKLVYKKYEMANNKSDRFPIYVGKDLLNKAFST